MQPSDFYHLIGLSLLLAVVMILLAAMILLRQNRLRAMEPNETRQRLDALINLAGDGIVLHELIGDAACGHFLQVTPALCTLLGYSAQELRELTPLDIVVPEDRQRVAAAIRSGQSRYEKTLIAKDGRRILVESTTRQYQHQGRTMVISVIRDMTERQRAKETARKNGQFKQSVLDAMTAHIAVLDQKGDIEAINESWRNFAVANAGPFTPPPPNTGIGVNYLAICRAASGVGSERAMEAHDGVAAVLAGQTKLFSLEYPCDAPDQNRWFNLVATPLEDGSGGAVVAHTEITALRELADELRRERDRFTRIAATTPGVICSFRRRPDGSACFPYASPAIEDLYGLRPEQLTESAALVWAMLHPDDLSHLETSITASAQTLRPWRDEFRVNHPIKGEIWVEGYSMPVLERAGGILWHGYLQDITERKHVEEALWATLAEKEALLREVHHRVKNNLAVIIDLLELQRESVTETATSALLGELGQRIHAMALIHEMLYQAGNIRRVDFQGYVQALVGHLRDALDPNHRISIQVTGPELWMNLDTAIPCGLIVNELVTNALKYAFPDHPPPPEADAGVITVAMEWDGAAYTLTIADQGIGLPPCLDWKTSSTLGLRLVRMLGQHQLRGQLTCNGTDGTCFTLRFCPR